MLALAAVGIAVGAASVVLVLLAPDRERKATLRNATSGRYALVSIVR